MKGALTGAFALVALVAVMPARADQRLSGDALVEALGCGACHTGVPTSEDALGRLSAPPLGNDERPLAPAYIFHYLANPRAVQPDIAPARMPTYDLDEAQRLALALFATNEVGSLRGVDGAFQEARRRFPQVDREAGRTLFRSLNCAGCHKHPEASASQLAPDLSSEGSRVTERWLRTYLADPVTVRPAGAVPGFGGQMPDFRLEAEELDSITGFLMEQRASDLAPWQPVPLSPFSMRKTQVLFRDRFSCLGCHQLGEDGGRVGPRLDGINQRLTPEYVRAVIQKPSHMTPNTIMPASLEQPGQLEQIATYLLQREGEWRGSQPVEGMVDWDASEAPVPEGQALYRARCSPCHGFYGDGNGFNVPFLPVPPMDHSDSTALSQRADDALYDGIYAGGRIMGKSPRMPGFGRSLSDQQIRSLVAYIRGLCGCQGPEWSRNPGDG